MSPIARTGRGLRELHRERLLARELDLGAQLLLEVRRSLHADAKHHLSAELDLGREQRDALADPQIGFLAEHRHEAQRVRLAQHPAALGLLEEDDTLVFLAA